MSKILLAEDDANLREIFEMRLKAEGFEVLTAGDGEEALVIATKEMPDLMVVDIMMPKISGFEMLETLRANPATSNIKAVMMTALGQAEDRERGTKLGVLKYLVKSQVTLEDFVRTIKEVLGVTQSNNQTRSNMDDQNNQTSNGMPPVNNPVPAPDESGTGDEGAVNGSMPSAPATAMPADEQSTAQESADVTSQMSSFASTPTASTDSAMATPPSEPAMPVEPAVGPEPTPALPDEGSQQAGATPPATPGETISPDAQSGTV